MDGINLNAAYFGAPDPFDDPHPKTSDDNSFLDNFDGVAWDEQVAKERAPIDGEEALRLLLKKYHTQEFYFRSIDLTWRRCIDILQLAMTVKELKGLRYSDSDEGGFVLAPSEEAAFCFRVRQPEGRLVMREVRFHPQALLKQPFAFAAYTRDPTLSERNYPIDFEPSMFGADDVVALKTRTATWSIDEFSELRAAFERAGVATYDTEQQCIDDMLL